MNRGILGQPIGLNGVRQEFCAKTTNILACGQKILDDPHMAAYAEFKGGSGAHAQVGLMAGLR